MTTMTTVGAIVMTPLMGKLLLGQVVPVSAMDNLWNQIHFIRTASPDLTWRPRDQVNAIAIAKSTIQVVLAPILIGMSFNVRFPDLVKKILPFSPIVGVIVTCLLVGTSVAGCASSILSAGLKLQASAALLHALGALAGYTATKPFYSEKIARTFAIEWAMKSSAFGFLLASLHFPEFAVRVPSAVSIVWMTLIGSSLAVASRFFPAEEATAD